MQQMSYTANACDAINKQIDAMCVRAVLGAKYRRSAERVAELHADAILKRIRKCEKRRTDDIFNESHSHPYHKPALVQA
jgi:hypothetical protein